MFDDVKNIIAEQNSTADKSTQVAFVLPLEEFKKMTNFAKKEDRSMAAQARFWVTEKLDEISA